MLGDPVTPKTTLAIILGASEYPRADLDPLKPAANAARDFERYLHSDKGLNLPAENVLPLFDAEHSPNEIDDRISHFLKDRQEKIEAEGAVARDLIFYYVGHGGFTGGDQEYFLALRTTTKNREGPSSLRMVDLAATLTVGAKGLRKYLILDCCFSAAAYGFFQQSDPVEEIRRKTYQSVPRKGTALLCSSSSSNVSLTPKTGNYPMFSGMLLEILRRGDPKKDSAFSMHEIGDEILEGLKTAYESKAVRPKVISPDEREGDVADIPLFPNASRSENSLEVRLIEVERMLQSAVQGISTLRDQSTKAEQQLSKRIIDLSQSGKVSLVEETSFERRVRLRKDIPSDVYVDLREASDARFAGLAWLCITLCLAVVDSYFLVMKPLNTPLAHILSYLTIFVAILGVFLWSFRGEARKFVYPTYSGEEWTGLPEVLSLVGFRYRVVFGLPVATPWFEIGCLIVVISAAVQIFSMIVIPKVGLP